MPDTLQGWLAHHAATSPSREAVAYLDESLTYAELNDRSNQLAHVLRALGIKPGDRVGIFMDKSMRTPVALYGILKSGAAYVPLDPASGAERLERLLDAAGIRVVVSARDKRRTLATLATRGNAPDALIGIDNPALATTCIDWPAVDQAPAADLDLAASPDDLAYIIYTSGSTGTPKGIMHTHRSCLAFATWAALEYQLHNSDRLSNHAPLHFDLSIFDYFAGLVAGATTVIIPEDYTRLPASYAELLDSARISVLFTVPFALIQLHLRGAIERFEFSQLRWAIFGGEPFAPAHLCALMARWPHVRFDNMYGPAEVNGVTHYVVPRDHSPDHAVPIGSVANGATGIIVGTNDTLVAPGETGELLMASPTMMRGYWQRPDLDAAAFCEREDAKGHARRFYRTGDLVRADHDGCLHFIGRSDRQVKVRGYRVELDDVELALTGHPAVEEGATYAIVDDEGVTEVRAEVTLRETADVSVGELAAYVKKRVPWYAAPATLDIAKHFPRTTSGKIDRRRLAEIAREQQRKPAR